MKTLITIIFSLMIAGQAFGIPACYHTVEETFAIAESIAENYPHLEM